MQDLCKSCVKNHLWGVKKEQGGCNFGEYCKGYQRPKEAYREAEDAIQHEQEKYDVVRGELGHSMVTSEGWARPKLVEDRFGAYTQSFKIDSDVESSTFGHLIQTKEAEVVINPHKTPWPWEEVSKEVS